MSSGKNLTLLEYALERRRLLLSLAALLAFTGVMAWQTMPRQEDPKLPYRFGLILTYFPGADAETIERLVVQPLNDELAEVDAIDFVESTIQTDVAITSVTFFESVGAEETDKAWDDVDDAVARARREFPDGVLQPEIRDELFDTDSVVLAVTGSGDPLKLKDAAEDIRRNLLGLSLVKRVEIIADPGEQIVVEYDDAIARRLGLDAKLMAASLSARNTIIPGGTIQVGDKATTLRPSSEFTRLQEIASTAITLPSGAALPLSEVARVRRSPAEPSNSRMRINGEPGVALAVVPQNRINIMNFGRDVRAMTEEMRAKHAPLTINEVIYQPQHVEERLNGLMGSLITGIAIVAGILFLFMGLRVGLVVSAIVPLVTLAGLGIFAMRGGELHQMSIAALVLALGMLVDNAIVMAENIQSRLDSGEDRLTATVESVKELFLPLGTATGTTLAAFVPMLLAEGGTGDFTGAIPVVVMLTLVISYVYAVFVTPSLAYLIQRPQQEADSVSLFDRLAGGLASFSVNWYPLILVAIIVIMGGTAYLTQFVGQQFFPLADRDQVIVNVQLPEGAHIDTTDTVARKVERKLMEHELVTQVQSYVGRGVPRFYYNLPSIPTRPNFAQLVANTTSITVVEELLAWVRTDLADAVPEAKIIGLRLEQGPPVAAPVEVRLYGWDLSDLQQAADAVLAEVRDSPGTRDAQHDLGLGAPRVLVNIDDAAAARRGMTRADVALSVLGTTRGLDAGQFRGGLDPVPILVRSSQGERLPTDQISTIDASPRGGEPVPLSQVATTAVEWRPAVIRQRDRKRVVSVTAQMLPGTTFSEILGDLDPRIQALDLPPGVRFEYGGEAEGAEDANASIFINLPIALMLLLAFLLFEFNSFRRTAIVFSTVPLSAAGVVPGLILSGQPFGFMSLLGVIALVGIVVNNAIVLLDVVENERAKGKSIPEGLHTAIAKRTRPILLTTATTVAGLMPLALSPTSLWPPLAWAMISGLLASTVLTLLVVPAQYRLLFSLEERRERTAATASGA